MCAIGRKAFGVHCTCVYKWISFDSVCFKSIFYETVISGALKIIEWLFEEFETDDFEVERKRTMYWHNISGIPVEIEWDKKHVTAGFKMPCFVSRYWSFIFST